MFVAIDGIDGAGKTTLALQLFKLFESCRPTVLTKEPTADSEWGQKLREAASNGRFSRKTELEYFRKDRREHIEKFIAPHLQQGFVVITDRYVDSTLAFQASSVDEADRLYEEMLGEIIVPDVTFILTCPVEIGLQRISRDRAEFSKFEKKNILERAKRIYESRRGNHYAMLDASGTPELTLKQALDILRDRFPDIVRSAKGCLTDQDDVGIGKSQAVG